MVRFSCFYPHIHAQKTKKQAQPPFETMVNGSSNSMRQLRRSLSLGCNLQEEGRKFEDNNSDEHTGVEFSCDGSYHGPTSQTQCPKDQDQEFPCTEVINEQYQEREGDDSSAIRTPRSASMISKSYSMPNMPSMLSRSGEYFLTYHSRSSEDLNMLGMMKKETCNQSPERNKDYYLTKSEQNEGYEDSYNYGGASNKDWIVPVMDGEESSSHTHDELRNEDFKIKRIESWVTDLHECGPVEEVEEIHDQGNAIPCLKEKEDPNLNPNMQAAKKYISSLSASATSAQLMNHGLVVIPFLSAFVSLKVVNLSGNSIVKITSGALPRGLHMLNLSKNKISTIEGLRELTRLRVLDLSYNRITRIGHGLASCSSLKEVYLAGNKISEVEGLHRLLKLAVLDLRFNKISTSKGLGQLAANYNTLQAVSLEGNPAQKNVGDEQLKKHLQGLLPHLAYYNCQSVSGSLKKDLSDRSVRFGANKPVRRPVKAQPSKTHRRRHHRPPLELGTMKPLVIPDFAIKKSQSMGALTAL